MAQQVHNVSPSYSQQITMGDVAGVGYIDKYGRNTEIDNGVSADVWDGGKTTGALPAGSSLIWVAPTAAAIHNITSTSADDDGSPVGDGARTIRIWGLQSWSSKETNEIVTMDGTSDVPTANSYVIIHRMRVLTKGSLGPNVGTITATATAPSATTITARMEVGKGQTQMSILGIPSIQTAYMECFYASINKASGVTGIGDISLMFNPEPDAELLGFLTKHTFGLSIGATSAYRHDFCFPKKFEGPGIIKMQVASSTNDLDVSAGFDVAIVDN